MITEEYPVPGSRLPKEVELADRFQVSRIVIREAMKILEDRGVVEVRAGRGTLTVAPNPKRVKTSLLQLFCDQPMLTIQEMEQLLELCKVLEETSAGLAAVRATADDLNEIEAALAEMRNSGAALEQAMFANLRFHRSIMRASHNPFIEMVLDPLREGFLQSIKITSIFNTGWEAHRNIFVEIQAHNPLGARQAVRRLMNMTSKRIRTP